MQPSVQAASRQFPSRDTAQQVTGACSSSTKTRPMRTSKRRTLPSTLAATISALHEEGCVAFGCTLGLLRLVFHPEETGRRICVRLSTNSKTACTRR